MKVRTVARREAILEVASQGFLEFGFKSASMTEIVRRIGGSKSTIYGYYPSKEALFQAVTTAAGEKQIQTAFDELAAPNATDPVEAVLAKFGEKLAVFLCRADMMATHRMVLAEAGHSNVGELFYEAGPKRGVSNMSAYFRRVMDGGLLRNDDPTVAALQFFALLQAEIQLRWYYQAPPALSDEQIKDIAQRAVATFWRAYAAQPVNSGHEKSHGEDPCSATSDPGPSDPSESQQLP